MERKEGREKGGRSERRVNGGERMESKERGEGREGR